MLEEKIKHNKATKGIRYMQEQDYDHNKIRINDYKYPTVPERTYLYVKDSGFRPGNLNFWVIQEENKKNQISTPFVRAI